MKIPENIQTRRLPGPEKPTGGGPWEQHHRDGRLGVGVILRSRGAGHVTQEQWYHDAMPGKTWPTFDELRQAAMSVTDQEAAAELLKYPAALRTIDLTQPCALMCEVNKDQTATHRVVVALGWHPSRVTSFNLGRKAMTRLKKDGPGFLIT